MRRVKWFLAAFAMGTLFFGCKKEQPAETPPAQSQQPRAQSQGASKFIMRG